jgi:hypothetical protein
MSHNSHTSISHAMRSAPSKEARDVMVAGFSATAYALQEGHPAKPSNPYGKSPETAESGSLVDFAAWREGAQMAERYWQDWAILAAQQKEEFERAAHDHFRRVVQPEREAQREQAQAAAAQAPQAEAPKFAAPGGEHVKGFQPITEEMRVRVNAFKQVEERVLRMVDALLTEFQNEAGDVAKEQADFQTTAYKRMSVEAQKDKILEFQVRMAAVQGALRWLAIGKTDIEKGFMAVNRSVFRPSRVALPEDEQDE